MAIERRGKSTDGFVRTVESLLLKRAVLVGLGLAFVVCTATAIIIQTTELESIGGHLVDTGTFEVSYEKGGEEKISPVCGCYEKLSRERWRGISIATRQLTIWRTGLTAETDVAVFPPTPSEGRYEPGFYNLSADIWTFKQADVDSKDLANFLSQEWRAKNLITATHAHVSGAYSFHLRSDKDTKIYLGGPFPVAAYLPTDESQIEIKRPQAPGFKEVAALIEERFNDATPRSFLCTESVTHPMLDVLGPEIVVRVEGKGQAISDPISRWSATPAANDTVLVAVLNVPFSARFAFAPGSAAARGSGRENLGMVSRERGLIAVASNGVGPDEYALAEKFVEHGDVLTVEGKSTHCGGAASCEMMAQFRLPTLPPRDGMFLFGRMKYLRFLSARGSLNIGTVPLEISAPSYLELRHVSPEEIRNDLLAIPVHLSNEPNVSKIDFQARAMVFINRKQISPSSPLEAALGVFAAVGSLASAVAGVVGAVLGLLRWRALRLARSPHDRSTSGHER